MFRKRIATTCANCGSPVEPRASRCGVCHQLVGATSPAAAPSVPAAVAPGAPIGLGRTAFTMQVEDVFMIAKRGTVVTGRVATGTVQVGDRLVVESEQGRLATTCTGIEQFRKVCESAGAGDHVGLMLGGVDKAQVAAGAWLRSAG
jgi:hypothetical protein